MFAQIESIVTSIRNTPFIKDVENDGLYKGMVRGNEREKLKSMIEILTTKYFEKYFDSKSILEEYDRYSANFQEREIVDQMRMRLIKKTIGKHTSELEPEIKTPYLYVVELIEQNSNTKYIVGTIDNLDKLHTQYNEHSITLCGKIESPYCELIKVYELMKIYGVANVRGSRYKSEYFSLEEANELIQTIMYINELTVENNQFDKTFVETHLLWLNGFTINEISQMKQLSPKTIESNLQKTKGKIHIISQHASIS